MIGLVLRRAMSAAMLLAFLACSAVSESTLERLGIPVRGASREFAFTNKESAFYYGETTGPATSSWQGFNVFGHEFLDDYELLIDGVVLPRSSATRTTVFPDYLLRVYPGGITEELRFVDSLAMFAVHVSSPHPVEAGVVPLFGDLRSPADAEIRTQPGAVLIARRAHLQRTERDNYPVWLAIAGTNMLPRTIETRNGARYSPVMLYANRARTHVFAFAVDDAPGAASRMAAGYMLQSPRFAMARQRRMEHLLSATQLQTADTLFDRAIAWAKLSLDALIMRQGTRGIFAGLPWFNNYWGRDTFISLPGAALVTGQFGLARQILESFGAFQNTDSSSSDYGRIPNLVTTTDKAYNTADGTPRFVMMARDYVERSGDSGFVLAVYPTVLRSIEGTLKFHADSLGFLTHADAETWMDAVGPDGPWSPRGSRGNDIQALWCGQLEAGVWFATILGDAASARRWHQKLTVVRDNFNRFFVSGNRVADRLRPDGTADFTLRPNQIFTLGLVNDTIRARILSVLTDSLTYPYGVASLSQDDPGFHPYHQYPPYYPKDAAYHNGTVWTWLQGALISGLCEHGREEMAWRLSANTTHQILDRGAVGTQSELLDAIPRLPGSEPRLSGTFSQAWNLAEFIRNFYDDYLGIRVDRYHRSISIRPHVPRTLGTIRARIPLSAAFIGATASQSAGNSTVTLRSADPAITKAIVRLPDDTLGHFTDVEVGLAPGITFVVKNARGSVSVSANGRAARFESQKVDREIAFAMLPPLHFQTPKVHRGLRALRGPDHPLLPHALVKSSNPAASILLDVADPENDDQGTGAYTYPMNPSFVPGSFDITRFVVRCDTANAYFSLRFRALSDPGWHPEYGFQLTMAAIAINTGDSTSERRKSIPQNARYNLDERHAYDRLVLVGGGVRVEGAAGRILAEYVPTPSDAAAPIGSARTGEVSFAIPLAYLGRPSPGWRFTLVTGAQDDHGGAGIGEFRTVNMETGEWNGGGKTAAGDPNIYDTLTAP